MVKRQIIKLPGGQSGKLDRFARLKPRTPTAERDPTDPAGPLSPICPNVVIEKAHEIQCKARGCTAKQILNLVMEAVFEMDIDDTLDFIEIFAGVAAFTKAMRRKAFRGWAFDISYCKHQDFLSITGLLNIAFHVRSLRKGASIGLLAPQCSSWPKFLAAHTTQRCSENIFGDESVVGVWEGNLCAIHVSWILQLMHYQGTFSVVEQPSDSMQGTHPSMETCYDLIEAKRFLTYLGAFGNRLSKATYLWSTMPSVLVEKHLIRGKPEKGTKESSTDRSGGSTRGKGNLDETAAYTDEFADCLAMCAAESIAKYTVY